MRDKRGVARSRGAVHDNGCARQGLEGGGDVAVGVVLDGVPALVAGVHCAKARQFDETNPAMKATTKTLSRARAERLKPKPVDIVATEIATAPAARFAAAKLN